MNSLHGYNAHDKTTGGREWSAEEQAVFWRHFETIRPTTSLFLNRRDRALEAKRRVPECKVVFRQYIEEDNKTVTEGNLWDKRSIQWHVNKFAPMGGDGLILNMWNEPHPPLEMLEPFARKYADLMDTFGALNIPIVGPNFGEGEPNETETILERLEPLWDAFDRWHDVHPYGAHEYGSHYGMLFEQPGNPYSVVPWRIGRYVELIVPWLENHGHKIPRVIFTEYGSDDAHDGQQNKRGYRNYWGGRQYAQGVIPSIVRFKRYFVIGYCLYSEGDTNNWPDFNVMGDTDYHSEIETASKDGRLAPVAAPPPTTTYPKLPEPTDPRWKKVIAKPKYGNVNVRQQPDKASDITALVHPDDELYIVASEAAGIWMPVKLLGTGLLRGWVSTDVIGFQDAPVAQPDEPPNPTIMLTREEALVLAGQCRVAADSLTAFQTQSADTYKKLSTLADTLLGLVNRS